MKTDSSWECSLAGAAWRPASLARAPRKIHSGNLLFGGEGLMESLRARWLLLVGFALLSAATLGVARRILKGGMVQRLYEARPVLAVIVPVAVLWAALFFNNLPVLPHLVGFDSNSHLEYIQHIRAKWSLPLPHQGFEMFQPPLYYILSASALSLFSISADSAFVVLRLLSLAIGIGHLAFIFLSLRLIFPAQLGRQLVGLAVGAFLPMHLYLSHYPTNETLAAALVTGSLYLTLRILRSEKPIRLCIGLGLCLGAALLAKASALLVVPFVFLAVARSLFSGGLIRSEGWRLLALTVGAGLLVCGWHYARIWIHFGTPLVFNWDQAAGFGWWQENGYRTSADFLRVERSLSHPLFSGFSSVPDGIYSTLWGDALIGGKSALAFRPPWNFGLMTTGYLLALFPTGLIVAGAIATLLRLVRAPDSDAFVLGGFAIALALAIADLSLRVPSYAQAKAFYGLSGLLPLCFFAAAGWDSVFAKRKIAAFTAAVLLGAWAINAYASFWIRHNSVPTFVANALSKGREGRAKEALQDFSRALQLDPTNVSVRAFECGCFVPTRAGRCRAGKDSSPAPGQSGLADRTRAGGDSC